MRYEWMSAGVPASTEAIVTFQKKTRGGTWQHAVFTSDASATTCGLSRCLPKSQGPFVICYTKLENKHWLI